MTKMNTSSRLNKHFHSEVAKLSDSTGIPVYVARNIVRFNRNLKTVRHARKTAAWVDPRTGRTLSAGQWVGPVSKRINAILHGTKPGLIGVDFTPEDSWNDAEMQGMVKLRGTLLSAEEFQLLAKLQKEEMKNDAMRTDDN